MNIPILVVETLEKYENSGQIKLIATDYPAEMKDFPTAIYRTSSSPFFIGADKNEDQTKWAITVELFSDKGLERLVSEVAKDFRLLGFKVSESGGNMANIKRKILKINGIADNNLNAIYQN